MVKYYNFMHGLYSKLSHAYRVKFEKVNLSSQGCSAVATHLTNEEKYVLNMFKLCSVFVSQSFQMIYHLYFSAKSLSQYISHKYMMTPFTKNFKIRKI